MERLDYHNSGRVKQRVCGGGGGRGAAGTLSILLRRLGGSAHGGTDGSGLVGVDGGRGKEEEEEEEEERKREKEKEREKEEKEKEKE
jgi:hypothetical protein